jgi:hypothetical protein
VCIKNYITEIYDPAHQPKNLLVKHGEKVDADEKGLYILHREVRKIKDIRDKRLQKMTNKSGCTEIVGKTWSQTTDTSDQHICNRTKAQEFQCIYNNWLKDAKHYKMQ